MASVPAADVAVAVASSADAAVAVVLSATLRRMYERKEDMRPAVGGSVVIGTGSVSTATPTPATFLLLWPEVKTFIDSQVHSIETLAAFADAFAEDSHDTGLYLHERVMFARYTAQTVDGDFKLRPEDYENCPDYAVLYCMLLRVMDETSDDAALHATQIKKAKHKRHKTDNGPKKKLNMDSDTQPKLSWNNEAERKQLSKIPRNGLAGLLQLLKPEYLTM